MDETTNTLKRARPIKRCYVRIEHKDLGELKYEAANLKDARDVARIINSGELPRFEVAVVVKVFAKNE